MPMFTSDDVINMTDQGYTMVWANQASNGLCNRRSNNFKSNVNNVPIDYATPKFELQNYYIISSTVYQCSIQKRTIRFYL